MSDSPMPDPGWYPDPSGGPALRWWNGVSWSDALHAPPGSGGSPDTVTSSPIYPELFGGERTSDLPGMADRARRSRSSVWVAVGMLAVLLIAAGIGLAAFVGSVSGSGQLDTVSIEDQISTSLTAQIGQDAIVDCPDSVPMAAGASFTCSVSTDDGAASVVEVTQDDDQGNVTWRVVG